ncbi:unnamed protein product [Hermetia illucens]|uniref:Ionotropic receptor n=1 Tax=Hermetia illucens TaxID=343691 RepID=A0A7R8YPR2_HERIL|nr:uncharacterized protein LOC119647741 [Hermetia illucens]CAD7081021.1 unnamed protein product [Hermetia illucens]
MRTGVITFNAFILIFGIKAVISEVKLEKAINELQAEYNFETILYFVSHITKRERIMVREEISSAGKGAPSLLLDGMYEDLDIREEFNSNILSVVFITQANKGNALEIVQETLERNFGSKIIFNFFVETCTRFELQEFMQWLWSENMFNSLVIMNNHSFTFNPYPYMTIIEIATYASLKLAFEGKLANLHKSKVTVLGGNVAPRTMKYVDRNGNIQYAGYIMKTILTFIDKYNGTLYEHVPNITKDITGLTEHMNNRGSDIHLLMAMGFEGNLRITYPVATVDFCLLMPYQKELPRMYYLSLPFQISTWCLLGIFLLALLVVMFVVSLALGIRGHRAYSHAVFGILRLLTQQLHFQARLLANRWVLIIYLLAVLLCMLISNLYQSELSSFFTKSIPAHQINDFSDLENFNYKILVNKEVADAANMLVNLKMFPRSFLNYIVTGPNPQDKLNQLNTDYGYLVGEDQLKLFVELQKRFSRKYYFKSKMCLMKVFMCAVIRNNYPFEYILNDIILRMEEAGLMDKWKRDFLYESIEAGFFEIKESHEDPLRPLKMEELYVAWLLFAIAILVAVFAFCGEQVWRIVQRKLS